MIAANFQVSDITAGGRIFYLEGPPLPWLPSFLILAGIAIQLAAIKFKRPTLVWCGLAPLAIGAILERDIALLAADIFIVICCRRLGAS